LRNIFRFLTFIVILAVKVHAHSDLGLKWLKIEDPKISSLIDSPF
jgi:hypothetical protein